MKPISSGSTLGPLGGRGGGVIKEFYGTYEDNCIGGSTDSLFIEWFESF